MVLHLKLEPFNDFGWRTITLTWENEQTYKRSNVQTIEKKLFSMKLAANTPNVRTFKYTPIWISNVGKCEVVYTFYDEPTSLDVAWHCCYLIINGMSIMFMIQCGIRSFITFFMLYFYVEFADETLNQWTHHCDWTIIKLDWFSCWPKIVDKQCWPKISLVANLILTTNKWLEWPKHVDCMKTTRL